MKKLLPLILVIFSLFLLQQAIHYIKKSNTPSISESSFTQEIENNFFKLSYQNERGEEVKLQKLNTPLVIIDFSATWCSPCLSFIETLNQVKKLYSAEKLTLLSAYVDDNITREKLDHFVRKNKIEYTTSIDTNKKLSAAFKVAKIPTVLVFYQGKLKYYLTDGEELELIEKLATL